MASGTIQVRDPIHGFLEIPSQAAKLVDTPAFQRLRGIRQLAFANLVYPGALHTRFDHTLGVFHLARVMAGALKVNEGRDVVGMAALLHDLGHGPFSHVSENALEHFADSEKLPPGLKRDKIHEYITAHIIGHDADISRLLGADMCQRVIELLSHGDDEHPLLRQIVSGPLDVDKQDYLLRDSYFCGVQYGQFDIDQFQRSLRCATSSAHGVDSLAVHANGLHVVEQYVMAKYYMTTQVYRHKIRLVTDQMLTRALIQGVEQDGVEELTRLYTYDGSAEFVRNYLQWDDSRLMGTFSAERFAGTRVHAWLTRLRDRRLLKRVFHESVAPGSGPGQGWLDGPSRAILEQYNEASNARKAALEAELGGVIAEVYGQAVDPLEVVVHVYSLKSVRNQASNDEASILVTGRGGRPEKFEEVSTVFRSIDAKMNETYLEIFAPVEYATDAARIKLLRELHEPIVAVLAKFSSLQPVLPYDH